MAKRGRPKILPDIQEVEKLGSLCLTEAEVASRLGITQKTLIERKKEYSEFSEALKRGKAKTISKAAHTIISMAFDPNVNPKVRASLLMFIMKCQGGWQERQQIDHTCSDGTMSPVKQVMVDLSGATREQISDLVDAAYREKDNG